MLWHISYISKAVEDFSPESLASLEAEARDKNLRFKVTGLLVFDGTHFFQYIEGEKESIDLIYSKINEDKRHSSVTTLSSGEVSDRLFAKWAMKSFLPSDFIMEDRVHILDILSQKHEKESIPEILSGLTIARA